jgi:hypothetical protein
MEWRTIKNKFLQNTLNSHLNDTQHYLKSNKINFKTKLKHSKSHNPPELGKNRVVSVQNYLKQKKR